MSEAGPERLALEALEGLGLSYELLPCDPDLADTAAFCAAYGVPAERAANTILVAARRGERRYGACVVLATTRVDVNGVARRRLGMSKASFAGPEETVALTGMLVGGVTPFGLPQGMPVLADCRVLEPDWVIVGSGSRSSKLRIAPSALLAVAEAVPDLARPPG